MVCWISYRGPVDMQSRDCKSKQGVNHYVGLEVQNGSRVQIVVAERNLPSLLQFSITFAQFSEFCIYLDRLRNNQNHENIGHTSKNLRKVNPKSKSQSNSIKLPKKKQKWCISTRKYPNKVILNDKNFDTKRRILHKMPVDKYNSIFYEFLR